jgi:hypothetical protein
MRCVTAAAAVLCITAASDGVAARPKTKQVRIEYVAPKSAEHQVVYQQLKQARVLELTRDMLNSIRLPRPLLVKTAGCDGVSNAWYEDGAITICYEFVQDIYKNAADKTLPLGISRTETIVGPLVDVLLHEAGHAVFDYLKVPLFGREEDAADQFSAYIMLRYDKDRARRLILGNAYQYKNDVIRPAIAEPVTTFADEHGTPAQRFFNVLCIAYGADPKLFADVVEMKYLPKSRAEGCADEYQQVEFAFNKLIGPHIDKRLARHFMKKRHKSMKALVAPR